MKSSEFCPLRDNLLVKPDDDTDKRTQGGILLPDKRKAPPAKFGTVVRVGPGLMAPDGMACSAGVKAGDRIAFPTFYGHEAEFDDGTFRVLSEREVLGGAFDAKPSLPLQPTKRVAVSIEEETPAFPTSEGA